MRKNVFGRKFGRDANQRRALFKGLMSSLVIEERITTTEEKAKAIKGQVEKLVTKAKHANMQHALTLLQPYLSAQATKKMLSDIAPRFTDRPGGYTRIVRLGSRMGDNAEMVFIEWVEKPVIVADGGKEKKAKKSAKTVVKKSGKEKKAVKPVKAAKAEKKQAKPKKETK